MSCLSVDRLSVVYGESIAIADVSFEVAEGDVVALLGANGAGKTSLLRCISGQVRPRAGAVTALGRPLAGLKPHQVATLGVAHVPEGRRVFPNLTAEENLNVSYIKTADAPPLAEARDAVYQLFPRLAERKKQNAGTMSGGEQQMLAIGRALMNRPKLLMLDEPSLGLSPLITEQVFEKLLTVRDSGTTLLLVEQNAIALEIATRGVVLANGRVAMTGSRKELEQSDFVRSAYLGL
jgi:branched-chain amino acid transport system ATP-binding protein